MRSLYNAALLPVRAASLVFGAWPRGTPAAELERDQRMARRLPEFRSSPVWIHGASVGEARISRGLAAEIRKRRPAQVLGASAVTPTGRAQLPAPPAVDGAFFCPLDLPRVQRRAFDALAPAMIVLIETELWPNLLSEASARRVPVVLVNARLAPERVGRYRFLSALYRPLMSSIDAIGIAGPEEAARFVSLGVPESKLTITGNVKFDLPEPAVTAAELSARLGLDPGRPVVAAGSTGAGEDALVLDAFEQARREVPSLVLLLAPRHPERFAQAEIEARRRGLAVARVSEGPVAGPADVLLVDTVGELASLYALATSAFVGGSLVRVGGHNLLEPLAAGAPVLFGPHTEHVTELAAIVTEAGCGERVEDPSALGRAWVRLASDRAERNRRAAIGREVLACHRGALARSVDLVLSVLDRARASRIG